MFVYGLSGFVLFFVIGVIVNAWLLRDVPAKERLANRQIRLRYGLLNWGIAIFGAIIGCALAGL